MLGDDAQHRGGGGRSGYVVSAMVTAKELLADAGFELAFAHLEIWFRRERIDNPELQAELAAAVLAKTQHALEHFSRPHASEFALMTDDDRTTIARGPLRTFLRNGGPSARR